MKQLYSITGFYRFLEKRNFTYMRASSHNKLNSAQLNLIKSFQYLRNEQEIQEIDSLVNFYLEKKLDEAISAVESEKNYTAEIYEEWLRSKK